MKHKKTLLSMALLFSSAFSMTGCAKEVETSCYGVNTYYQSEAYGDTIFKIDVKVKSGKFTSATIEETYSPNVWARVSDTDLATLGEGNYLTVENGTTGNIYFAQYIKVNNIIWTGVLRNDDYASTHHEYVRYYASTDSTNSQYDLWTYLSTKDASTYKLGDFCNTYFNDVQNDNIKILKKSGTSDAPTETEIKPYFPSTGKLRSDASWKSSTTALCKYLEGKKFNYTDRVSDDDFEKYDTTKIKSGTWYFNPTLSNYGSSVEIPVDTVKELNGDDYWEEITDCKSSDISAGLFDVYMNAFNQAFASVEYDSLA